MKIKDLLIEDDVSKVDILPDKEFRGSLRKSRTDDYAAGYFSKLKRNEKNIDPHEVVKYNYKPMPSGIDEGFRVYIDYLQKHDIYNIHCPRVLSVQRIKDKHGHYIDKFSVEKLIPKKNLSFRDVIDAFSSVLSKERIAKFRDIAVDEDLRSAFLDLQVDLITYAHRGTNEDMFISDEFKKALEYADAALNEFIKNNPRTSAKLDLHPGNIMYRRTPYGLQPVINDPIAIFF